MAKKLNIIISSIKKIAKKTIKLRDRKMSKKNEQIEQELQDKLENQIDTVENELADSAIEELQPSENEKLKQEVADLKDKYLRLYSEFDNFRKRTAKEKLELIQTASEGVIVDLLSVLDDYERAKANAKEGEISDGIDLIFNKLANTLQNKGLKEMLAKGEVFDADIHDCITQFPAPTEADKGKIVEVVEKGYLLKDKVIRFAKVVVGN
ncbi:MAG: nucleotide exchange factor GrpE [Bacteroidota bacterium]